MDIIRGEKHEKTCIINVKIHDVKNILNFDWEAWE